MATNVFAATNLCSRAKGVTKVDAHHLASEGVEHEVGEMSVTHAQHPLARGHLGMGRRKVRTQSEESFSRGRQFLVASPV